MLSNVQQALTAKIDFIASEKAAVEGNLHDLLAQKEELDEKIMNLEAETERWRNQMKIDADTTLFEIVCEFLYSNK